MLLEITEFRRILLVFTTQFFIILFFLTLAFILLKRNRNRSTLMLSIFFLSVAIGFILITFGLPIKINPMAYVVYFTSVYIVFFGQIFLVLFSLDLLRKNYIIPIRAHILIALIYGIVSFIILSYPGGITYNIESNWRPIYSWNFLLILYLFNSLSIITPELYISVKLFKQFSDSRLKKKLKYFFSGTYMYYGISYGTILYNTWNNIIFQSIWIFISFLILPAGILIYYGIGKNL